MFLIQALHSDGWRSQGTFRLEYWACLEAQTRSCSDGRTYRIVNQDNQAVVCMLDNSSCKALSPLH